MTEEKEKLIITDLTWYPFEQPLLERHMIFYVTIKNVGSADLVAGSRQNTIRVYVDRMELPLIKFHGDLAVGETKKLQISGWEATAGNHVVTATVNFAQPSPDNWNTGVVVTKNLRVAQEPLPVPEEAAAAGMTKLVFSDDFTTLSTIDVNNTGKIGYKWYTSTPFEKTGPLLPTDYELTENGILLKQKPREKGAYGLIMMDANTSAGWGYTHGYLETRFRFPAHRLMVGEKGSPPSIWALPPQKFWSFPGEWVEMDCLEYWGDFYEGFNYTVTLHNQEYFYRDGGPLTTYWARNDKTSYLKGLNDGEWHTMGWLWEEGRFTTYLDGKEIMTQRWSKDGYPEPPATSCNGGEVRKGTFSAMDQHVLPMIIHGMESWPLEMEYLNIWQAEEKK